MDDFTLILLIKDRPDFFERWVNYTIIKKPPFSILISDGSKKKISKDLLIKLKNNNIKFKYKRFKFDKNYNRFSKKIYYSLKYCKTNYVALCADDDFYINKSIGKSLNFLKKNPKYICYGSKMIIFGASNKYDQVNSIPTNFSVMYKDYKMNNKSKSKKNRLIFFLKNSNFVIFHNIFRRKDLIQVYKKVLNSKLTIPNLVDLYANSLVYCKGLVKTSKEIIRFKQYHQSSDGKSRSMEDTVANHNFKKENEKIVKELCNVIYSSQKQNKKKLFEELNMNFQSHYSRAKKNSLNKKDKFNKISNKIFIKNLILNKFTNKYYYLYKRNKHIDYFSKFIKKIKDQNVKQEINLILNFFKEKKF